MTRTAKIAVGLLIANEIRGIVFVAMFGPAIWKGFLG